MTKRYASRKSSIGRKKRRGASSVFKSRKQRHGRVKMGRGRHHYGGAIEGIDAVRRHLARDPALNLKKHLTAICSRPHFCMTFGRESAKMNGLFEFETFKYAESPVRRIANGGNGVVSEIIYNRNLGGGDTDYKASAILKTLKPSFDRSGNRYAGDNLFIEAHNGIRWGNVLCQVFPCFVETYGFYQYKSDSFSRAVKQAIIDGEPVNAEHLKTALRPVAIDYRSMEHGNMLNEIIKKTCAKNENNALLAQYIHNPLTLGQWFDENKRDEYSMSVELPRLLFQIYGVLGTLAKLAFFTHYDLHASNVLLYEIPEGKYVEMEYVNCVSDQPDMPNLPVRFKTRYIAKIIDYGRCFFPTNNQLYDVVCHNPRECSSGEAVSDDGYRLRLCGYNAGYKYFYRHPMPPPPGYNIHPEQNYYINSLELNISHDLRLINSLLSAGAGNMSPDESVINIALIMDSVRKNYTMTRDPRQRVQMYGVDSKPVRGQASDFRTPRANIKNVIEMSWALYNLILNDYRANGANDAHFAAGAMSGKLTVDLGHTTDPLQFVMGEGAGASSMVGSEREREPFTRRRAISSVSSINFGSNIDDGDAADADAADAADAADTSFAAQLRDLHLNIESSPASRQSRSPSLSLSPPPAPGRQRRPPPISYNGSDIVNINIPNMSGINSSDNGNGTGNNSSAGNFWKQVSQSGPSTYQPATSGNEWGDWNNTLNLLGVPLNSDSNANADFKSSPIPIPIPTNAARPKPMQFPMTPDAMPTGPTRTPTMLNNPMLASIPNSRKKLAAAAEPTSSSSWNDMV